MNDELKEISSSELLQLYTDVKEFITYLDKQEMDVKK